MRYDRFCRGNRRTRENRNGKDWSAVTVYMLRMRGVNGVFAVPTSNMKKRIVESDRDENRDIGADRSAHSNYRLLELKRHCLL